MASRINVIVSLPGGRVAVGLEVPCLELAELDQLIDNLKVRREEAAQARAADELLNVQARHPDERTSA